MHVVGSLPLVDIPSTSAGLHGHTAAQQMRRPNWQRRLKWFRARGLYRRRTIILTLVTLAKHPLAVKYDSIPPPMIVVSPRKLRAVY